jgi:tetratricopeptide (TPR) repeat protein
MSEYRQKGDILNGTYRVLNRFPFVEGVLYYTEVLREKTEGESGSAGTRFIHALALPGEPKPGQLEELKSRSSEIFFPIEQVFLENGFLHQVFNRMEGDLLGIYLMRSAPLPVPEVAEITKKVAGHLIRCYDEEQFAPIDPQNIFRTSAGEIRFLFGGPTRLFGQASNEPEDVKKLASLLHLMLTGKRPDGQTGSTEPVRSLRKDVPLELENLLIRALSPDPLKRPRLHDFWKWGHRFAASPRAIEADARSAPETRLEVQPVRADSTGSPEVEPKRGEPSKEPAPTGRFRRLLARGSALLVTLVVAFISIQWLMADPAEEALAGILDPTVERDPDQAFSYFHQSNVAYEHKEMNKAVMFGRKALSADLERKEYYQHLANLYGAMNDYARGLQVLQAAAEKFSDEADIHDAISVYAYYLKDYNKAKTAADRAVELDGGEARYRYHQAKVYAKLKQTGKAIQSLTYATYLSKDNARYHHDLAVFLYRSGKLDDAIIQAKKAADYADKSREKYDLTLGILYLKKWEQISKNRSIKPDERKKEMEESVRKAYRAFNEAVDKKKQFAEGHYYRSVAYYLGGKFKTAKSAAEKAAKLEPENPLFQYQLGLAFMALGDKQGALSAFEKAFLLDNNNPLYQDAIKKAQQMKAKPAGQKEDQR